MKKNVFISSTYEDLIEHRKAIWGLLNNYEVNVKGMEAFGARKETALETCLNELSQSDIYIGVIGFRFGSIEVESGKSYTQLEYERAISEKKEILIYLINEEDTKVEIKNIDFDESRKKLQNFKSILRDKHTIDTFTTTESLVTKLKSRLDELLLESCNIESAQNDYEKSKDIVERFLLLPKTYNDRDVRLTVEFKGKAFSISKEICSSFGFSYGSTIGVPIKIWNPEINDVNLDFIIIEEKDIELYFNNKGNKIELIARLLFSEKRFDNISANFFDRNEITREYNPHYRLCGLGTSSINDYLNLSTSVIIPEFIDNQKLIKGEGKAIIVLENVIS